MFPIIVQCWNVGWQKILPEKLLMASRLLMNPQGSLIHTAWPVGTFWYLLFFAFSSLLFAIQLHAFVCMCTIHLSGMEAYIQQRTILELGSSGCAPKCSEQSWATLLGCVYYSPLPRSSLSFPSLFPFSSCFVFPPSLCLNSHDRKEEEWCWTWELWLQGPA